MIFAQTFKNCAKVRFFPKCAKINAQNIYFCALFLYSYTDIQLSYCPKRMWLLSSALDLGCIFLFIWNELKL